MRRVKRPSGRVTDRKLSYNKRLEAGRKLALKNSRRDDINKKHYAEVDALQQKLDLAKSNAKEKIAGAKKIQKTILPKADILNLLQFDLTQEYDKFGKVGPPYVGMVEKVIDSQTVKLSEDAFEDMEEDVNGKLLTIQREGLMHEDVLDPALWRDFKIEYPVREQVKIDGQDVEDRDLKIGELEWNNEVKTRTLDTIKDRTQELVDNIITFFQLNGFLSGSVDELALLGKDSATTIGNVKEELTAAQMEFQKWKAELDTLKAIHHNPYGCKAPDQIITGRVIPIFEFYNTITQDYVYSSNFEWHMNQSAAEGYMFQRNFDGHMKDPKQVKFNELGMKYKYVNKGLYKIADVNSPKVLNALGAGAAVDWGEEGPDGAPTDKFTTAIEGYVRFPYAETYEFKLYADNTGFLEIQGEDGSWERIIENYKVGTSDGMRQESNPRVLKAGGKPPSGLSDADLKEWNRKNAPSSGDNAGKFAKYGGYKVSKQMAAKGKRTGIRLVVSENKGEAGFSLAWRAKGKKTKILKKFSYRYKNGSYIRRWRRRHHYRTVEYWDYVEVDAYLPIEKQYLSLASPENYEFNRVAFGAYDPQEAEHKELTKYKHIHKFHMSLSLPELGGDKADNQPRAMEAAGNHYLGDEEKPPKEVKHIKPDEWESLGFDFAALKGPLPKPHPELEKDYEGHGNTLPIHKFYNRETNTYRYMILPDGRKRQKRTPEGVLMKTSGGGKAMEVMEEMIGAEYVEEQAGRHNLHYEQFEGQGKDKTKPRKNRQTGEVKPAPATIVGQGYDWVGIAFYGFEAPGLPANIPPEVLIHEGKNSYSTIIKKAKWLDYHANITLDAKAEDPDGKVKNIVWTIVSQQVDISHVRAEKRGTIIGRTGRITHPFPIGSTKIKATATDNRDEEGSDQIEVIVIPPDKKNWRGLAAGEYIGKHAGIATNRFIIPISKYVQKPGWDGYTEKVEHDVRDMANVIYQQGFRDAHRGRKAAGASAIGRLSVTRKKSYKKKVQIGWKKKTQIVRWRKRTKRVPVYGLKTAWHSTTHYAKHEFSKVGLIKSARTPKLRQYPSDTELKNLMTSAYERGFSHGEWPHYLSDTAGPANVQRRLKSPLLRDPITKKEKWDRGAGKRLKKAGRRLKKAFTVPKKARNFARKARKRWRKIWSDYRLKTNINSQTYSSI